MTVQRFPLATSLYDVDKMQKALPHNDTLRNGIKIALSSLTSRRYTCSKYTNNRWCKLSKEQEYGNYCISQARRTSVDAGAARQQTHG
jgi:hypothetical protein